MKHIVNPIVVRVLGTEISFSPSLVENMKAGDTHYFTLTLEINGVVAEVDAPVIVTNEMLAGWRSAIFVDRLTGDLDE